MCIPQKDKVNQKQKADEFECYKWSMERAGFDPLNLPKVQAAPVEKLSDGPTVVGAAKGTAPRLFKGTIILIRSSQDSFISFVNYMHIKPETANTIAQMPKVEQVHRVLNKGRYTGCRSRLSITF